MSIESTNAAYLAATPVALMCVVVEDRATEPLAYQWSSNCSGDCFITNEISPTLSQSALRSVDSGEHTCLVTDTAGNTGFSTIQFTVTGENISLLESMDCISQYFSLLNFSHITLYSRYFTVDEHVKRPIYYPSL